MMPHSKLVIVPALLYASVLLWASEPSVPPASPAVLNNLSALDFRFNFPEVNLRAGLPQWMTSRSPLAR